MKRIVSVFVAAMLLALCMFPLSASAVGSRPAVTADSNGAVLTTAAGDSGTDDTGDLLIAPAPDSAEDNADGINIPAVTAWIVAVSAVAICAIMVMTIILAKKNGRK